MVIEDAALCPHCLGREAEVYATRLKSLNAAGRGFCRLWTECQNCAKTMHEKVFKVFLLRLFFPFLIWQWILEQESHRINHISKTKNGVKLRFLELTVFSLKVNCSARDCPLYYRREKVRGELNEAFRTIIRFGKPELDSWDETTNYVNHSLCPCKLTRWKICQNVLWFSRITENIGNFPFFSEGFVSSHWLATCEHFNKIFFACVLFHKPLSSLSLSKCRLIIVRDLWIIYPCKCEISAHSYFMYIPHGSPMFK